MFFTVCSVFMSDMLPCQMAQKFIVFNDNKNPKNGNKIP
jgi:hypothetical protein